ncbi:prolyl 4-hydroxylase subunit alpha-1-like [Branchiostoma floridae]|uniref:procollagen-proline 4-dioxygenase n=1 Tax=Branchiostoma floridae TaxID=7739 RepID=A0A9J7LIG5_BRAFL|nr:prolyl 4-hydroxylase subunit alpha-1-like [Branchiostoma floridae]
MYSSMSRLEKLVAVEEKLVEMSKEFLKEEKSRLHSLESFVETAEQQLQMSVNKSMSLVHHPVGAYLLVKRLSSDWLQHVKSVYQPLTDFVNRYNSEYHGQLPSAEDAEWSAHAILRLQEVYQLDIRNIISGQMELGLSTNNVPGSMEQNALRLKREDIFAIAKGAYRNNDYRNAVKWLNESIQLMEAEEVTENRENLEESEDAGDTSGALRYKGNVKKENLKFSALQYLGYSLYKQGDLEDALAIYKKASSLDPKHDEVRDSIKLLQRKIRSANMFGNVNNDEHPRPWASASNAKMIKYMALCRHELKPRPDVQARLKCRYQSNGNPYLLLGPVKTEVLSRKKPEITLFYDVITDEEAQTIKNRSLPKMFRSRIGNSFSEVESHIRISQQAWLHDKDDEVVSRVSKRIGLLTGLNTTPTSTELLQVLNYGLGGQYEPHHDYMTAEEKMWGTILGNRMATFLMYLSDVTAGGATVFPVANVTVPVVKNAGLLFMDLLRSGRGDVNSLHAGCPVVIGSKWIANKWIHEGGNEFRRKCGLSPNE